MKKILKLSAAAALSVLSACGVSDSGIRIDGVPLPTESMQAGSLSCMVKSGGSDFAFSALVDVAYTYQLFLPLQVTNLLEATGVDLGPRMRPTTVMPPTSFAPLRFEIRWECEAQGFRADLGPVVLPAFDPKQPFCLDTRSEVNKEFVGFDVVNATGTVVDAGSNAIVRIQPVPYQMGAAVDDLFRIAQLADACCRSSTNCDGTNVNGNDTSCNTLGDIFMALDPSGTALSVKSAQSNQASADLLRFRPFAVFNGDYQIGIEQTDHPQIGAIMPMRMRGILEGIGADGELMNTDEFGFEVGFCRLCGNPVGTSNMRLPAIVNQCFYFPL